MVVDINNNNLRIRVTSPRNYQSLAPDDVGSPGKHRRIAGHNKEGWKTQSWMLNLQDVEPIEAKTIIEGLKIPRKTKEEARKRLEEHYGY